MPNEDFGFESLHIYKIARIFKIEVCRIASEFPSIEKFRLTDQIIRSSRSINALIAEGHGRFTYPDQIHFCIQARGSLTETISHLTDALDEKYISEESHFQLKTKAKEIERLINGYLLYLRNKRDLNK